MSVRTRFIQQLSIKDHSMTSVFNLRAGMAAVLAACALASPAVHAADFAFSGNLAYNTDVVSIAFTVAPGAGVVKLWTDSWQSGTNFDPVAAVWAKSGSGYALLQEVDDDDTIGSGQGSYDSGLAFGSLAAGQYLMTIAASPNYANGATLAAGFALDGSTPTAIADWTQPGSNPNFPDQKGAFWSAHLAGVSQAAPVPEPSTWAMLAAGLGVCGLMARRRPSRGLAERAEAAAA